jgi:SH3 domain/WW domain
MRALYSQADSMSTTTLMTTTASTISSSVGSTRPLVPRRESTSPAPLIVRALYDYHSPDSTNLSFQAGTLIRVLTQLQSGWWDGCIDGERGWFPCNFVTEVVGDPFADDEEGFLDTGDDSSDSASGDEDDGERVLAGDTGDDDDLVLSDEFAWVPQADKSGRTFFLNTQNGETSWELPGTKVYLDDWEDSRISDEEIAPRSSMESENSEGILMLGPTSQPPEYIIPETNVSPFISDC